MRLSSKRRLEPLLIDSASDFSDSVSEPSLTLISIAGTVALFRIFSDFLALLFFAGIFSLRVFALALLFFDVEDFFYV
jgi:hypothetical protein